MEANKKKTNSDKMDSNKAYNNKTDSLNLLTS